MDRLYFDVEEAQALIPRIRPLMEEVRELKRRMDARAGQWQEEKVHSLVDTALARGHVEYLTREINTRLEEVGRLGGLPKDLDLGLVDFPARLADGREIFLCWRLGETTVSHWHGTTEGFIQRKFLNPTLSFQRPF